jgi:hypothetical protein
MEVLMDKLIDFALNLFLTAMIIITLVSALFGHIAANIKEIIKTWRGK